MVLELLNTNLDLVEGTNKTVISYQQKGILVAFFYKCSCYCSCLVVVLNLVFCNCSYQGMDKAVRELLPYVEHRLCTRNLESNLTKVYTSQAVKNALDNATHPQAFNTAMKDLQRHSKGAFEKMNLLDPGLWSKAFFKTHSIQTSVRII